MSLKSISGKSIPEGMTVTVDHTVQRFTIEIRSSSGIHSESLKRLIQNKYEVTDIQEESKHDYVR